MNSILEQLEINHTFLYQFGLFVAFYIVLTFIYLKPFQKLIEKRNHKLNDDVASSAELLKAVEAKLGDYELSLAKARTEARLNFEKAVADVRSKEDATIAAYKEEMKKDYMRVAQQLQDDRKKVEAELQGQVEALAEQLVSKVKGA